MCRYDSRSFDAEPAEARAARYWIVDILRRWELEVLVEEFELAGSELTTNALLHTHSGFDVTLAACGGSIELAVRDRDPRAPVIRPARLDLLADVELLASAPDLTQDDCSPEDPVGSSCIDVGLPERHPSLYVGPSGSIAAGRGLIIVDAIAEEWGVASHQAGKDVWMRIPIPREWPYLHECTCAERSERTPSGHPVSHLTGDWDAV